MAARTGMANIISLLRQNTNAGTADYSIAGTTYWVDDQLQTVLDRHSDRLNHLPMKAVQESSNGTLLYKAFYYGDYEIEQNPADSDRLRITDSSGSAIGTANYSINYESRFVTFTSDQGAEQRYITGWAFDMAGASAEVWGKKASHVADRFDMSSDNHSLSRSQLYLNYRQQEKEWKMKGKNGFVQLRRADSWW